jgi:hypothetical protein
MRTLVLVGVLFGMVLVGANGVMAADITPTVLTDPGILYNTAGLTGYATGGDMMDGMVVTVGFAGGSTSSDIWADTGVGAGAATGTGWSLSLNGNSNTTAFSLVNSGTLDIVKLIIDARPGMTVFDIIQTPEDSPGSSGGGNIGATGIYTSYVYGPAGMSVTGTYRNRVAVGGTFYGDLYAVLDIAMVGATGGGGLASGQTLQFYSDTDNATTTITAAPEPSTLALLGMALGAMGFAYRRRQ